MFLFKEVTITIAILNFVFLAGCVSPVEVERVKALRMAAEQAEKKIIEELKKNEGKLQEAKGKISNLEIKLQETEATKSKLEDELQRAEIKKSELKNRLEEAEEEILKLKEEVVQSTEDSIGLLLAIGVNEYHHLGDVEAGRAAAESFARTLLETGSISPGRAVLLVDDAERESDRAGYANMRSRIRQVSSLADENDTLIIFFTGHGVTIDGEAYLVPQDGGAKDTSIPLSWVKSTMRGSAAREKVLILDACHSGAGVLGVTGIEPDMTEAADLVVMTSSRGDEVSYTTDEGKGIFSTYLIEGLAGAADENRDGQITVGELYRYVNEKVREWSLREGKTQRPMILPAMPPDVVVARTRRQ